MVSNRPTRQTGGVVTGPGGSANAVNGYYTQAAVNATGQLPANCAVRQRARPSMCHWVCAQDQIAVRRYPKTTRTTPAVHLDSSAARLPHHLTCHDEICASAPPTLPCLYCAGNPDLYFGSTTSSAVDPWWLVDMGVAMPLAAVEITAVEGSGALVGYELRVTNDTVATGAEGQLLVAAGGQGCGTLRCCG